MGDECLPLLASEPCHEMPTGEFEGRLVSGPDLKKGVVGSRLTDILSDNTVIGFYLNSDLFEGLTKKGPLRPAWRRLSGHLKDGEIIASDEQVSLTIPINTHKVLTKVSGFGANGSKKRELHGGSCRP